LDSVLLGNETSEAKMVLSTFQWDSAEYLEHVRGELSTIRSQQDALRTQIRTIEQSRPPSQPMMPAYVTTGPNAYEESVRVRQQYDAAMQIYSASLQEYNQIKASLSALKHEENQLAGRIVNLDGQIKGRQAANHIEEARLRNGIAEARDHDIQQSINRLMDITKAQINADERVGKGFVTLLAASHLFEIFSTNLRGAEQGNAINFFENRMMSFDPVVRQNWARIATGCLSAVIVLKAALDKNQQLLYEVSAVLGRADNPRVALCRIRALMHPIPAVPPYEHVIEIAEINYFIASFSDVVTKSRAHAADIGTELDSSSAALTHALTETKTQVQLLIAQMRSTAESLATSLQDALVMWRLIIDAENSGRLGYESNQLALQLEAEAEGRLGKPAVKLLETMVSSEFFSKDSDALLASHPLTTFLSERDKLADHLKETNEAIKCFAAAREDIDKVPYRHMEQVRSDLWIDVGLAMVPLANIFAFARTRATFLKYKEEMLSNNKCYSRLPGEFQQKILSSIVLTAAFAAIVFFLPAQLYLFWLDAGDAKIVAFLLLAPMR
jgi:hypothetical protein